MHKGGGAASASTPTSASRDVCGRVAPLREQLLRDMQHWRPRAITPKMLGELQKRDDPVRASLMIVNRTVYYQRPVGYPRSPVLTAIIHDGGGARRHLPGRGHRICAQRPRLPACAAFGRGRAPLPLLHYQTRHHGDVLPGRLFREGSYDR